MPLSTAGIREFCYAWLRRSGINDRMGFVNAAETPDGVMVTLKYENRIGMQFPIFRVDAIKGGEMALAAMLQEKCLQFVRDVQEKMATSWVPPVCPRDFPNNPSDFCLGEKEPRYLQNFPRLKEPHHG